MLRRVRRCGNYGSHADASKVQAPYLHDQCGVRTLFGLLPTSSSSYRTLAVIFEDVFENMLSSATIYLGIIYKVP
jgi:hypothetical protein